MNRRGFALLGVLWAVTALAGIAAIGTSDARLGARASANRIALTRAAWAAEGCLALVFAATDGVLRGGGSLAASAPASLAFSREVHCRVESRYVAAADSAPTLTLLATGSVRERPPLAHAELTLTAAGRRAAVVRRRVW